ncbi:hypothetical protein [uncultured Aliivibrio sp.]|uniref:hypothetical protein n=1 Tax=uncultured Aliivibrio sp. TaxID=873085 RepID=UPI002614F863|nr:hypothetical protein [uncultured Aliivibrio sp.]
MKIKLLALSVMLAGSLSAAELYVPSEHYPGGEQISFNGNIYETQWWANPGQSPADITENSWDSPWVWVSEDAGDVTLPEQTTLEYFERGLVLNGENFGFTSEQEFNISAVERYKNRLYITQDINPGEVLIVDATTGEELGKIDGVSSGLSAYRRIYELYIDGNRLFVASLSSNRVDIYDLDNNHQLIMSLGTGSYSGTNGLTHPQAVVSNQDYIIVAETFDEISVYRQQDAVPENHLRAPRYARLKFDGTSLYNTVQMHVIEDYLFVFTANNSYRIYDLNKVEAAAVTGEHLAPEMMIHSSLQKIDKDGDQLVINMADQDGRIEWHNITDVIANDFRFISPTKVTKHLDGQSVGSLRDLHYSSGELISATNREVRFDTLRTNDITFMPGQQVETTDLAFDQIMPSSISEILTLDEQHHILTDRTLRSVKVNSPVKTEFRDKNTVLITNYAPVELKDLTLELKLNGVDRWFTLANLDRIPAFTQITLPLSAFGDGQFNTNEKDGYLDLTNLFASNMNYAGDFDYRFHSFSDSFAQKLANLKPDWEIRFSRDSDGYWRSMNALYAREWLIILTNLAYMVSQEEFEHLWFNYERIFGYNLHGLSGEENKPGGYFTPEDYQHWYDALMNRPVTNVAVSLRGGGQGDHHTFGVDTWNFYTHYYGDWSVIAHEFGHGFDGLQTFPDGSVFAASWKGWQPLISDLANYQIRKGDLPYMDDSLNGFYKPEYAEYHHVGVSQGMRKHRADNNMNMIDNYFMSRSTMPRSWATNGEQVNTQVIANLKNQEQMLMAYYPMKEETSNLCRFTYKDGEQYYGYVSQEGEQSRCKAGNQINYREIDGSRSELVSNINEFDWLSLYNPENAGEPVLHQNGQPLCQYNRDGFYGTGFINTEDQCTQLPNVYASNGNHWTFSSNWTPITYSSSQWIAPTTN